MKRWKIVVLVCTVITCLSLSLVGCQQETYTPEPKTQAINSSALGKTGTLRVGVNATSAPLAGQTSSSSRIVGIDADVAAYLADELGLKVELVDVGVDAAAALSDGRIDIALGIDSSDDDPGFWRSTPYLQTGVALFGSSVEDSVPTIDSKAKIAAQASSKSSWRVTNLFGDDALVPQPDLKSAFDSLVNGSARYIAADAVIGTYVSYSSDYADKIVALLQETSGYCAAVSNANTDLQNVIGAAVNKLVSGGVMNVIEKKWLGTTLSFSDIPVVKNASGDAPVNQEPAEGEGEQTDEAVDTQSEEVEGEATTATDETEGEYTE